MELINGIQNKFHHLAQILAAFSNSFLEKREDDSQSALLWNIEKSALQSQIVNNVFYLELNYTDVYLRLYKGSDFKEIDLLGLTQSDIDAWIRETISDYGLEAGKFHYNLGFKLNTKFDTFIALDSTDEKAILQLVEQRNIAQRSLEKIKISSKNTSSIYVWPHHFDTGMLVYPEETEKKGFGLGYAIADGSISDKPYYYAYIWGDKNINYDQLPNLTTGNWVLGNWKGAIIPVNHNYDLNIVNKLYEEFTDIMRPRL
ncbi:hypothetical protein [Galbibacter sp. PAP.153]|uniref:hypothetical protein n=1 Tax=Galbibacter sp. PAP.153 TaxID=3104623 RepID=UPI0030082CEA